MEDRVAALEAQIETLLTRSRNQSDALQGQQKRLQDLTETVRGQQKRLRNQERVLRSQQKRLETLTKTTQDLRRDQARQQRQSDSLQVQILSRFAHLNDQTDLLKSSLEVPREYVEEFEDWKSSNPLTETPLVSVTVATYNRAALLTERCIPSVLNQTYDNLELVVVGDGCTDETEEAVAEISDPRLTFVNLAEQGPTPSDPERRWMVAGTLASNKGLSMAGGDLITHLDDDDEYTPDRLEKLVRFASEGGYDLVWHPFWWETEPDQWTLAESNEFALAQVTNGSVLYRSWFQKIAWDNDAHLLMEPGDWNRYRKIKFVKPTSARFPEPLLKHYRERSQ